MLDKAVLDGMTFDGATLDNVRACGASFMDVTLENTFLRGADLRKSTGLVVEAGDTLAGAEVDGGAKLPGARAGLLCRWRSR